MCCIEHMGFHVVNWMLLICECTLFFWLFCPSCRQYQGTAFLLLRAALKKISTDLGTITVPSSLHLLLSGPADSGPGEFNPLFCGRFGQSGIKCRPLLTLWALAAVASGDPDFVFSHTSLLGTWAFAEAGRARKRHRPPVLFQKPGWTQREEWGECLMCFVCLDLLLFLLSFILPFPQIGKKMRPETLKKILSFFFFFNNGQLKEVLDLQKMLSVSLRRSN